MLALRLFESIQGYRENREDLKSYLNSIFTIAYTQDVVFIGFRKEKKFQNSEESPWQTPISSLYYVCKVKERIKMLHYSFYDNLLFLLGLGPWWKKIEKSEESAWLISDPAVYYR